MADRPIIFSAPMVRALLDGRKSQTRRVLKVQPPNEPGWKIADMDEDGVLWMCEKGTHSACRLPYAPGDRLWVREGFVRYHDLDDNDMRVGPLKTAYRADGSFRWMDADTETFRDCPPWKPSIHMPRWASRLTLAVTDVRVQRLQEISAADSIAEGVQCDTCKAMGQSACNGRGCFASIDAFRTLWGHLHGPEAWGANPWVAAINFTTHRCNIDAMDPPQ